MMEFYDIEEYKGLYQVSKCGQIYSLYTKKILKIMEDKDGYSIVNLYKNKKMKTRKIHRLVASVFIENINNYPIVNHIDGDKKNNNSYNLEWCTDSQNKKHAFSVGLMCTKGERHSQNKLTNDEVLEIRRLLDNGLMKNIDVAKLFGVHPQTTSNIKTRKTWRHI